MPVSIIRLTALPPAATDADNDNFSPRNGWPVYTIFSLLLFIGKDRPYSLCMITSHLVYRLKSNRDEFSRLFSDFNKILKRRRWGKHTTICGKKRPVEIKRLLPNLHENFQTNRRPRACVRPFSRSPREFANASKPELTWRRPPIRFCTSSSSPPK